MTTQKVRTSVVVLYAFVAHDRTGDLEGLKVSHDFDGMEEGEERILTLKDSRILDNEGE